MKELGGKMQVLVGLDLPLASRGSDPHIGAIV